MRGIGPLFVPEVDGHGLTIGGRHCFGVAGPEEARETIAQCGKTWNIRRANCYRKLVNPRAYDAIKKNQAKRI